MNMRSNLIPLKEPHKTILEETLTLYDNGGDMACSPMIQSRIGALHLSGVNKPVNLMERQLEFLRLYDDIRFNGYASHSPMLISWDDNGRIILYDGFHRLAILRHLGLDLDIPVTTSWKGIDGQVGRDFPLVEVLRREAPTGDALYQPIDDTRCKGWYVDRPDSPKRLEFIKSQLVGETVLDIGCSEGYFSRELAKAGYIVTSIDHSPGLIASARYLTTKEGLEVDYHCGEWYDILPTLGNFDNILMLSVIHNDMKKVGVGRGLQKLWAIHSKCNRLFLEIPNMGGERQWNKEGYPNWDMHNLNNIKKMEIILGMSCTRDYLGVRSILLFDRIPSNLITIDTKHGFSITYPKTEDTITHWLLQLHDWEPKTTQFIKDNLKPGQTFVDVGANAGYFTVLASRLVGPTGRVYSFEPAPDMFEVLKENTKNLKNVELHDVALSNYTGEADFFGGVNTGQRGLQQDSGQRKVLFGKVQVRTLDSYGIKADMVKIDTEGTEMDVVEGAKSSITDSTLLIVENATNTKGFKSIGQADDWRPLNVFLQRGEGPNTSTAFHLIGLAHTKSNKDYIPCAITQNVVKLGKMLTNLGYKVYHYGAEGSDLPCTEHVDCISDEEQQARYGDGWKTGFFECDKNDQLYRKFNQNVIRGIKERANPRDIILVFNGNAQKPITDALSPMMSVEASVGYEGVYLDKVVFESYAWMHYIYARISKSGSAPDGRWYDAVIPLAVDPGDFIYQRNKDNYFLYAGRLVSRKGIHIAQQVCDKLGERLVVMGQGSLDTLGIKSPNVEHIGVVSVTERAKLFAGAKGLFAPTIYLEPFGAIVIEASMSGTPVITTDWGAFPETVIHGVTGYRCRTFDDFVWAAQHIGTIKPSNCRKHAMNYSLENIQLMYKEYFQKLIDLFGKGWYTENPGRTELNWLRR